MSVVRKALKIQVESQRRRALAPDYDPVRRDFEFGLAENMEREAQDLLMPLKPLKKGLGGEILPLQEDDLTGLELTLERPDLLNLEASAQRSGLIERAGVLELGIETAQDVRAKGAAQKMISHQMAAAHKRAMDLLAESQEAKDVDVACKKARTAAKMMDAFSRAALTLQRLQTGASQVVQVQHVQVNGPAVIGMGGHQK
jgi:hypothetical protein